MTLVIGRKLQFLILGYLILFCHSPARSANSSRYKRMVDPIAPVSQLIPLIGIKPHLLQKVSLAPSQPVGTDPAAGCSKVELAILIRR
jgi:hypothetical protein